MEHFESTHASSGTILPEYSAVPQSGVSVKEIISRFYADPETTAIDISATHIEEVAEIDEELASQMLTKYLEVRSRPNA